MRAVARLSLTPHALTGSFFVWPWVGIELHLPFFGRCDTMQENFRALHMKFDEDFVKMEFFSAEASLVPEEVLGGL